MCGRRSRKWRKDLLGYKGGVGPDSAACAWLVNATCARVHRNQRHMNCRLEHVAYCMWGIVLVIVTCISLWAGQKGGPTYIMGWTKGWAGDSTKRSSSLRSVSA